MDRISELAVSKNRDLTESDLNEERFGLQSLIASTKSTADEYVDEIYKKGKQAKYS